ncbi:MAG TPA: ATP-binding cassette domain-containing protein [Bacillota bacterium]|nr:ATP-binding cassette domain-containing protein [Bacillota bacterium]HPT86618.1 ATP-binding cassette domain-containing protein [Bacillota bacterium]
MKPVISIEQLSFTYAGSERPALSGINVTVNPGEFIGITGPAGAGKSTLVLCLNGIIPHFQRGEYQGRVWIDGLDTVDTHCTEISRKVGSVFQDPEAQIVASTVEDEIAFGLENFGMEPEMIEARITDALQRIGIEGLRYRSTVELSGGQKQRVAIAAAVALRPKILVLDEPTSELDPLGTKEVFEVLKQLNQEYGLTIIVVEQKINILLEYIERLWVMNEGRMVADQPPRQIINQPELLTGVGLQIPPVSELVYRLKAAGYYSGELPLTVDEAYWALLKCRGGKG